MKIAIFTFVFLFAAGAVAAGITLYCEDDWCFVFPWQVRTNSKTITDFDDCVQKGHTILESYPERCRTPDGKIFTRDIGNELEKTDLIRSSFPRPGEVIASPLRVTGEARGYWFFEASFSAELYDGDGKKIGTGIMQTEDEWMTEDFVPYSGTVTFPEPLTDKGTLILNKDNPSGLPQHDDELRIPVRFSPHP